MTVQEMDVRYEPGLRREIAEAKAAAAAPKKKAKKSPKKKK